MLNVFILDTSASARHFWYQKISNSLDDKEVLSPLEQSLIPNISLNTLSIEELNYRHGVDLYIIGEELILRDPNLLKLIKEKNSQALVMMALDSCRPGSLIQLEGLARVGIDDLISVETKPLEIIIKLIILSKKLESQSSGKVIIFDSAKGGQGVTTVCAATGEFLCHSGKKVLLVDLDCESQDLSRFLQARPYFNENLTEILSEGRALTRESFNDCLIPVFHNGDCYVLTPPGSDDYCFKSHRSNLKIIHRLISLASSEFDYILIDAASLRNSEIIFWYRLCSEIILVTSNDPASCFSIIAKLKHVYASICSNQKVYLLENRLSAQGLSSAVLRNEINFHLNFEGNFWIREKLKFDRLGSCWPASGRTVYSLGGRKNIQSLRAMCHLFTTDSEDGRARFLINPTVKIRVAWVEIKKLIGSLPKQILWGRWDGLPSKKIELPRVDIEWQGALVNIDSSKA